MYFWLDISSHINVHRFAMSLPLLILMPKYCRLQIYYTISTHTHTTVLLLCWNLSGTTRVSRYQKG